MLWTALIGLVVFMAVALLLGPEWWSSSRGILKEQKRKQKEAESKLKE